jgi:hypothetical protein
MKPTLEEIAAEALGLPREAREHLASLLVESLSDEFDSISPDYGEILRRLAEIRAGTAEMIDGEEFMQEVRRDAGPS